MDMEHGQMNDESDHDNQLIDSNFQEKMNRVNKQKDLFENQE